MTWAPSLGSAPRALDSRPSRSPRARALSGRLRLPGILEQKDQIADEDEDDQELHHKRTTLVEPIDHKGIEVARGTKFPFHQISIVGYADFAGGHAVQAGIERGSRKSGLSWR